MTRPIILSVPAGADAPTIRLALNRALERLALGLATPPPKTEMVLTASTLAACTSFGEPTQPAFRFNTREHGRPTLFTGKYGQLDWEAAEEKRKRKAARKAAERAKQQKP